MKRKVWVFILSILLALLVKFYFGGFGGEGNDLAISLSESVAISQNHRPDQKAELSRGRGQEVKNDSRTTFSKSEKLIKESSALTQWKRTSITQTQHSTTLIRKQETVLKNHLTGRSRSLSRIESLAEHVVVVPAEGVRLGAVSEKLAGAGFRVLEHDSDSLLLVAVDEPEKLDSQPDTLQKIDMALAGMGLSEPDYLYYPALAPDDLYFDAGRLWGLKNDQAATLGKDIEAEGGWDLRTDASDVVVAVTDTGLRTTHQDLKDNLWVNPGEVAGDGIDNDGNGIIDDLHGINAIEMNGDLSDDSGHGTHVAGTIGAQGNNTVGTVGVCWEVQLMGLRFIGPDGGSSSSAVRAIDYARENGADIINASWGGGGKSQAIKNAVRRCRDEGILFVAAAGNSATDLDEVSFFPASIDLENVITVAASDRYDNLAGFSSFGRYSVDLAAPGSDVVSTFSGSDSDYKPNNGTSMAAPHVSGALALAKAHFPGDSAGDLKTRLLNSCDQIQNFRARTLTGGRLNLRRLLGDSSLVPSHDAFATPLGLDEGYAFWRGRNDRATRETLEAQFSRTGTGGRSLWFSWQSPRSGTTSLTFSGDEAKINFILFTKSTSGSLQSKMSATSGIGVEKQVEFEASEGVEYVILLDSAIINPTSLSLELFQQPGNDNFAEAVELSPTGFETIVNNRGATTELFEETLEMIPTVGFHSLWWKWTPAESNNFLLSTQGSQIDTTLEIFTLADGEAPSNLTLLDRNDDLGFLDQSSAISLNLEAGETYYVRVQSVIENQAGKIFLQGRPVSEPEITFQPQPAVTELGGTGFFEVGATGEFLEYQWFLNGSPIPGAEKSSYRVRATSVAQFGNYSVRISNPIGAVLSDEAALQESRTAPKIDWISSPQAGAIGNEVRLAVGAGGSKPLSFQWSKEGILLPGETAASLSITLTGEDDGGEYRVSISNDQGVIESEEITVGVIENPLQEWQNVNTRNVGAAIKELKYADGNFVAVSILSEGYLVRTSRDGRAWKSTFLQNPDEERSGFQEVSLAYGDGTWLLAAPSLFGRNELLFYRSDDLETWETLVIDSSHLSDSAEQDPLVFYNGFFYASLNGRVIKSERGEIWNFESVNGEILRAHLFEPSPIGLLALRTDQGTGGFLDASGIWQEVRTANNPGSDRADWVKWHQGRFIAATSQSFFKTSSDGLGWTREQVSDFYGNGKTFISDPNQLISFSSSGSRYSSSSDGITWSWRTPLWTDIMPTVAAGASDSFVIGTSGGQLIYGENVDTVTHPDSTFPLIGSLGNRVLSGGGRFVIPYYSSLLVSGDGFDWKQESLFDARTRAPIDFPSTVYGTPSNLWLGRTSGTGSEAAFKMEAHSSVILENDFTGVEGESLNRVVGGPLGLIAEIKKSAGGRQYGIARSSDDGSTWSEVTLPTELQSPSNYDIWIYEANGVYFYARDGVRSFATTDLTNWSELLFFMNSPNIAFAKGKFWWMDPERKGMRSSDDGLTWSEPMAVSTPRALFRKMKTFGDTLVLFEANGSLFISDDGSQMVNAGIPFRVKDFEILDDTIVVLGTKNEIARTTLAPRNRPNVSILSPREDTEIMDRSIRVEVEAFDASLEDPLAVTLYINQQEFDTLGNAPYLFSMPNLDPGVHHLRALAVNSNGETSSDEVVFTVTSLSRSNDRQGLTFEPAEILSANGFFFALEYGSFGGKVAMSPDGANWREISFPVGVGGIISMVSSNGILLLEARMNDRSTKYLVSDDGLGWTVVDPPFDRLYIQPNDSGFFASSTREHFSSQDGINWNRIGSVGEIPQSDNVVGDPDHVLYTTSRDFPDTTLRASHNRGRSWTRVAAGDSSTDATYVNRTLFVKRFTNGAELGVSTDGINITWVENPGDVYFAGGRFFASNNRFDSRHKTSVDGLNWVEIDVEVKLDKISFLPSIGYLARVNASFHDPLLSGLQWSEDGINWKALEVGLPDGLADPRYFPVSEGLLAKTKAGAYFRLDEDGRTWVRLTPDHYISLSPAILSLEKTDDDRVFGIASNIGVVVSLDQGKTWREPPSLTERLFSIEIRGNDVLLYHQQNDSYFLSENGGPFEEVSFVLNGETDRFVSVSGLATFNDQWILSADAGKFYRSDDGRTWSEFEATGLPADNRGLTLESVPNGLWGSYGSFSNRTQVYSSDGISWSEISHSFGGSNDPDQIIADGDDLIISSNRKTWRTSDRVTFTEFASPFAEPPFVGPEFHLLVLGDSLYSASDGLIYRTEDDVTWEVFQDLGEGSAGVFGDTALASIGDTIIVSNGNGVTRFAVNPLDEIDLRVANLEAQAGEYGVGEELPFSFILSRNPALGELDGEVEVRAFLTRDRFNNNADDIPLENFSISWPGDANDSFTVNHAIILPEGIEAGDFHLGITVDPDRTLRDPFFENGTTLTASAPVNIPAFVLSLSTAGLGSIDLNQTGTVFPKGSQVALSALSGGNSRFAGWSGDVIGGVSDITVLMDRDVNLEARFLEFSELRIEVRGKGTATPGDTITSHDVGAEVGLTAVPSPGWEFAGWTGDLIDSKMTTSISMPTSKRVTANFRLTFSSWVSLNFDENDSAETKSQLSDPDRDGVTNFQEWLHGSNPKEGSSNGILESEVRGPWFVLVYQRQDVDLNGSFVSAEGSRDQKIWSNLEVQQRVIRRDGELSTIEARIPVSKSNLGFLRLKYQAPQ